MKRRVITGFAAVLIGLAGTAAASAWLKHAAARNLASLNPVAVLVAARSIPAGTTAGAANRGGMLKPQRFPASSLPPGAVTAVTSALSRLVTDAALAPGQILTRAMLGNRVRDTSGLAVPAGTVVVTVQFCLAQAVAGYVKAGSQVAVYGTSGTGCTASRTAGSAPHARLILPRLLVLATGPAPAAGPSSPAGLGSSQQAQQVILLTVAVPAASAAALIALAAGGDPYLALLTPSAQVTPASAGH